MSLLPAEHLWYLKDLSATDKEKGITAEQPVWANRGYTLFCWFINRSRTQYFFKRKGFVNTGRRSSGYDVLNTGKTTPSEIHISSHRLEISQEGRDTILIPLEALCQIMTIGANIRLSAEPGSEK